VNTSGAPGKIRAKSVRVVARGQIGSTLTAGKGAGFSSFTFFAVGAALFIDERYLNGFFKMTLRIVFGYLLSQMTGCLLLRLDSRRENRVLRRTVGQ
jgi:hypothetical protein